MADRFDASRAIGSLENAVKTLTDVWQKQDKEANDGRRRLYEKFEELKESQTELANRVSLMTRQIAEIEPAVKRFEVNRQRAEGAKSVGKILWFGLTGFAAGLGYALHELLQYFWPPRH